MSTSRIWPYVDHSCLDMLAHWKEQHQATGSDVEVEWEGLVDRYTRLGKSKAMSQDPARPVPTPELATVAPGASSRIKVSG